MILSPLPRKRVPLIPIGIMLSNGQVMDESGEIASILRTPAKVIYTTSPMYPLRAAKKVGAMGYLIGNKASKRWVRFHFSGRVVFPGLEKLDLQGLIALRDESYSLGVQASSIQGMSFLIARYTLAGYVKMAENEQILPFNELPMGARLHDDPGVYDTLECFDIKSAYLWAISTLPVPAIFSHVKRIHLHELCAEECGYVRATVWLRNYPIGPVPYLYNGSTIYPTGKDRLRRILLTLDDFRLLCNMGMRVSIDEAWIGSSFQHPFDMFGVLMREWRSRKIMSGIAKQVANTLWGSFGSNGAVWEAKISPYSPRMIVKKSPARSARCMTISSTVVGRIRAKVYTEGVGSATVHIHTDGLMSTNPGVITGENIGDWRFVGTRRNVEILAPGWYSYDSENGRKYKTAGRALTARAARIMFAEKRNRLVLGNPPDKIKGIFS